MGRALDEIEARILARYPTATFEVARGDDPPGMYVTVMVDVDYTTEVLDLVTDRLLELQIDERLPLYVVPIHTPERIERAIGDQSARRLSA